MKKRLILLFAILILFAPVVNAIEYLARVTYYVDTQTASGSKPEEGITVAACEKTPMGKKLHIPALKKINGTGIFIKQDVGPAVEKRIASKGKFPIIDVYVSRKEKIKKYSKSYPALVWVYEK